MLWNTEVDVAPGPIADVSEARIYYTGDGTPKKTNWAMATGGAEPYPSTYLEMGVPKPTAAPNATVTVNGSGTAEDRAYVFTWVSTFGTIKEESKPSDPDTVTVNPIGATVTINAFPAPPVGHYNITHKRIYRTVTGATTSGYEFVAEIAVGVASYNDTFLTDALGEALSTIGWDAPPATLSGIVALPTGSLAGFVGNTVYFSEPYFPHSWPTAYAITLPAFIVGLAVIGSSVVIMTDTTPFFIHGGIPGDMSVERVQLPEPCIGKPTIATDGDGVIYASPNGLVGISQSDRGLLTTQLFTADEWQPLLPNTMHAAVLQGRYIGVFPSEVPARAIVLTRADSPALTYLRMPAVAMHVDAKNAELFYLDDVTGKVYQLDADTARPLAYEWRSKRWHLDAAVTFSVIRVDAEYTQLSDTTTYNAEVAAIGAANAAAFATDLRDALNATTLNEFELNGSTLLAQPELASSRTLQVVIYGDGEAVANITIDSLDPIRLEPFKCRELEFSIMGNVNVRSIHMATTMDELKL
jgi:hypothetical protein